MEYLISVALSQIRVGNRKLDVLLPKKEEEETKRNGCDDDDVTRKEEVRVTCGLCAHHQLVLPIFFFFVFPRSFFLDDGSIFHQRCICCATNARPGERRWRPYIYRRRPISTPISVEQRIIGRAAPRAAAPAAAAVPSYNIQRVYSSCFMVSYYVADRIKRPPGNVARLVSRCVCVCVWCYIHVPRDFLD